MSPYSLFQPWPESTEQFRGPGRRQDRVADDAHSLHVGLVAKPLAGEHQITGAEIGRHDSRVGIEHDVAQPRQGSSHGHPANTLFLPASQAVHQHDGGLDLSRGVVRREHTGGFKFMVVVRVFEPNGSYVGALRLGALLV